MKSLNQNLVEVVELLNDGQFHDGTSIGNQLNITRAGVWKVIKKLQQYGIPFTSIKGKGYQLNSPLFLLNTQKLASALRHPSIELHILEKTTSTNDYLKQLARENKKIIACIAETQTNGKGRLQRQWHSPFAENIYLSMLYPFEKDISELSGLSLIVGLATCKAIESKLDLKGKKLQMKWPNDIYLEGHKLGGILIEIQAESHGFCQVIIGIGINVNMNSAPKKEISQAWTSLFKVTNQYIDRNILCAQIMDILVEYMECFSSKGLGIFIEEWQKRDHLVNSTISILSAGKTIEGICVGINLHGHLQIKTRNEGILTFSSGDATILK